MVIQSSGTTGEVLQKLVKSYTSYETYVSVNTEKNEFPMLPEYTQPHPYLQIGAMKGLSPLKCSMGHPTNTAPSAADG